MCCRSRPNKTELPTTRPPPPQPTISTTSTVYDPTTADTDHDPTTTTVMVFI